MCGRAAQTRSAASSAARAFSSSARLSSDEKSSSASAERTTTATATAAGASRRTRPRPGGGDDGGDRDDREEEPARGEGRAASSASSQAAEAETAAAAAAAAAPDDDENDEDNYNLSPGMGAVVLWSEKVAGSGGGNGGDNSGAQRRIASGRKVWGLVTRGGTKRNPLPSKDANRHYQVFNARSDTLYAKPTFARLVAHSKTCVLVVDGYYEWKLELKQKQPYYVYPKVTEGKGDDGVPYLLLAAVWTSVPTGRTGDDGKEERLDTFAVLTTDATEPMRWLHQRMPLPIWDVELARQWLERPSERLLRTIEEQNEVFAGGGASAAVSPGMSLTDSAGPLRWHAVTPKMSSIKYRSSDAIKALPRTTLDSFFQKKGAEEMVPENTGDIDTVETAPNNGASPAVSISPKRKKRNSATSLTGRAADTDSKSTAKTPVARREKKPKVTGPLDSFFSSSRKTSS